MLPVVVFAISAIFVYGIVVSAGFVWVVNQALRLTVVVRPDARLSGLFGDRQVRASLLLTAGLVLMLVMELSCVSSVEGCSEK